MSINYGASGRVLDEVGFGFYLRAASELVTNGILEGIRPEPTLDQARREFSLAVSRVAKDLLFNKYGPLVQIISVEAVDNTLRTFEERLNRTKGDITLVLEEIVERSCTTSNKLKP